MTKIEGDVKLQSNCIQLMKRFNNCRGLNELSRVLCEQTVIYDFEFVLRMISCTVLVWEINYCIFI
jgi:hypothetical protein